MILQFKCSGNLKKRIRRFHAIWKRNCYKRKRLPAAVQAEFMSSNPDISISFKMTSKPNWSAKRKRIMIRQVK